MIAARKLIVAVGIMIPLGAAAIGLYVWRERAPSDERIIGYFPQDWEDVSSMVVRTTDYHGAHGGSYVTEYRWSRLGSQYRQYQERLSQDAPEWSAPVAVGEQGEAAIRDALNIAVRDQLWQQGDLRRKELVMDGGEIGFEFCLGPHQGRFRLIQDPDAPHLRSFLHRIVLWTNAVRSSSRLMGASQSATP